MRGPVSRACSRVDVIADQDLSPGNEQFIELRVKRWDAARMTQLVHGLKGNDEIESGRNSIGPVFFFKICLNKNDLVCEFCEPASAELQHLGREIDQRVARDITFVQQGFGEKTRSAAQLENRQCTLLHPRGFGGESFE